MTRDEAKRAAVLSLALEESDDLVAAVNEPYTPAHGYAQMLLMVGMHECGLDPYEGGSGGARIFVDLKTAGRITQAAQAIILEELAALGVEPSPALKDTE